MFQTPLSIHTGTRSSVREKYPPQHPLPPTPLTRHSNHSSATKTACLPTNPSQIKCIFNPRQSDPMTPASPVAGGMVMSAPLTVNIPTFSPMDVPRLNTDLQKTKVRLPPSPLSEAAHPPISFNDSIKSSAPMASHPPSPVFSPVLTCIFPPGTRAQQLLCNKALNPVFASRYSVVQELGSGGFGFVCSAVRTSDRREVAVKFIIRSKIARTAWAVDHDLGSVPMEVYILKNICHQNIVRFLDYYADADFCYLVTELHGSSWSSTDQDIPDVSTSTLFSPVFSQDSTPITSALLPSGMDSIAPQRSISSRPSMDLFECIEKFEHFTEAQARCVFRQIVSAVAYLQSLKLVHRDIKDENVLIDCNFNVKLIDFGSASFFDDIGGRQFDRFLGTIQYAAPEILKSQKYRGPEAEVWSLGCCLFIMLTGQVPFTSASHAVNRPYSRTHIPLSELCIDLLDCMLDKNFQSRATIDFVQSHPWMKL
ncbi:hypothetical protein BATDEDRAFT_86769 [Batrachochytrium dendrobatidis JAM81]|uniref:Protein kinase domain-containing protein n=2 Tax=Batrachochytrium dendrobatidis TaxID=109871 RepID=F4NYK6_BATDJ|nr:uncharacterized protein BATDEDRAFT_86769 [Batrachochytrium dendrobatidis JAM81]EGF82043.1 hypothetical protein BATDEDRAFT_86769 [Batrachochytrium dendrobatidis JAM81]KAJ8328626.1 hypothetical protein O5D80_003206 [Batrachochytrium dendrobatidis]KAK5671141.1 hypothetical protein QVD99_002902 [Batrachochytrium dendrobatidis]OAJ40179.1 hypothetical protein BDEG_23942 [Batrachochytrium dendrobatidis JEL423]|eukprot:XP_006677614.1 hypothetical protein BATDEDRAFT_86769 [Batrachochytrium dendrobatidis JAM81]